MIKPTVLLILLLTACGSLFLRKLPGTTTKYNNSSGYHTFIMAAFAGMLLFGISFILVSTVAHCDFAQTIGSWFSSSVSILLPSLGNDTDSLNLISVCIVSLIIAFAYPKLVVAIYKARYKKSPYLEQWKVDARDKETPEFLSLFFDATDLKLPIAFTLSNRKVYIGYVIQFGVNCNDVHVLPLVSGYRHEKTLDLVKVINYQSVIKEFDKNKPKHLDDGKLQHLNDHDRRRYLIKKFSISIPLREIVHANIHDINCFNEFLHHRFDDKGIKPTEMHFSDVPVDSEVMQEKNSN
ncbi:hypothetical protein CKO50_05505 [Pseudoalteromonas sp. HM-SA03]|uniref:hypothetical protein n=1 Tax=Pseudoalteromonas sp. HM-SA03 TaxID=2029678 RepID=UPI000BADE32C|nr:hypothetical protein [Pseudoalteromonas sp. HM-SA03]PAY02306.1 hypothetical protein CKO50_05505 [Pseudoalteromonas sp. HM-SA03]